MYFFQFNAEVKVEVTVHRNSAVVSAAGFSYMCCWMLGFKAASHHASVVVFVSLSVCTEWFSAPSASALSRRYCVWKKTTKEQEAKQHNPAITSTGTVCCVRAWAKTKGENYQMSSITMSKVYLWKHMFLLCIFLLTHYSSA